MNNARYAVPIQRMVSIGEVSSARMVGQMGLIPAGSESNALDVMSHTKYIANGGNTAPGQTRFVSSISGHLSLGQPPFSVNKANTDLTPTEEGFYAEHCHQIFRVFQIPSLNRSREMASSPVSNWTSASRAGINDGPTV